MYKFINLDNSFVAFDYLSFTFPSYQQHLYNLHSQSSTVAIGALDDQKPIGLALAKISLPEKSARVLSVYIAPKYRHQGIGTALLTRLEAELVLRGCQQAQLTYTSGGSSTKAWERVLENCHWLPPEPQQLVCKCDHQILNAPWLQKEVFWSSSFTIFPWQEITTEERILLCKQQETKPWIPSLLVPFHHEYNLETLNSLGLRYRGEVVGWVLTHRLAPDTIRYTCSYIRPELQKFARILSLYSESIKRHTAKPEIPNAVWTVPFVFNSMVNFVNKHMSPYMKSIEESRISHKALSNL